MNYNIQTKIANFIEIQKEIKSYLDTVSFIDSCTISINMYCIMITDINKTSLLLTNYLDNYNFTSESMSSQLLEHNIKIDDVSNFCAKLASFRQMYPEYYSDDSLFLINHKLCPDLFYTKESRKDEC